ncbi:WRKY transcription factor 55 [Morus notabilis]|uniref:WRKY transcription factor 55 n=1 Tax=Morus notabilis TaxID=981085 RepID=UPI000CED2ACD|nr:WRKY transcription factor 55 [Morus notabilis]
MFKPKTTNLNKQKYPETMEDYNAALSLILQGCKLAKELESNVENPASEPSALASFCDEIVKVLDEARGRLRNDHHQDHAGDDQMQMNVHDANLHEWLMRSNSCYADQAMDMTAHDQDMSGNKMGSTVPFLVSSIGQRPRRRKDDAETRIVNMAAPQIGNTEIPPDDGYTWRKYGQKEIMGSKYPRGYYRCTHQKLYDCPAKKQVQRLDHDPSTFEVIYHSHHTCHMSATAPSMLPSQPIIISQDMTHTVAGRRWLSVEFSTALGHGTGTSSGACTSGTGASTGRYNKDQVSHDQFPVVDMADVMFNFGSSSTSNSMDFLFPSVEEKNNDNKGTRKMSD